MFWVKYNCIENKTSTDDLETTAGIDEYQFFLL
jgi:hypothetical protein